MWEGKWRKMEEMIFTDYHKQITSHLPQANSITCQSHVNIQVNERYPPQLIDIWRYCRNPTIFSLTASLRSSNF